MIREAFLTTLVATGLGCVAGFPERPGGDPVTDEPLVDAEVPPPPVSGGTLLVSRDGHTVYASDPDRDLVWAVDISSNPPAVRFAAPMLPGDEPGRLAEDATGRVHVALRRGGAVASFDPSFAQDVRRTPVCAEPRGIAYEATTGRIHVACTSGELVSLRATDGVETRRLQLPSDLRDVLVHDGQLSVTRFRTAELLTVNPDGTLAVNPDGTTSVRTPPRFNNSATDFVPDVAWRTVDGGNGNVVMVHQRAADLTLPTGPGAYYSTVCDSGVVHTTVTTFDGGFAETQQVQMIAGATLPVDVAVSENGQYAVAAAGADNVVQGNLYDLQVGDAATFACEVFAENHPVAGEPIAVAFAGERLVIQARSPARIVVIGGGEVALEGAYAAHSGHDLFHRGVEATDVACASCHPEGREDGRTWKFDLGERRTQSVSSGVLGTLPLHWGGDLADFNDLVQETLVNRMLGDEPTDARVASLATWLDQLPEPNAAPPQDPDAVARGREIFTGAGHCNGCHAGEDLTNDATVDVGTGGAFQVPSLLGVSARAPYLHDGSAATLEDRFDPAIGGGDMHGTTSHLADAQINDLVAYLETL